MSGCSLELKENIGEFTMKICVEYNNNDIGHTFEPFDGESLIKRTMVGMLSSGSGTEEIADIYHV